MVSHGVALYARVSTDQQARDNTIASQVAALHERIAAEGDRVLPEHAYIDEGYSGAGLVRPALERLRDAVAMGLVERLYVHAPDRLARRRRIRQASAFSPSRHSTVETRYPAAPQRNRQACASL